MQRIRLAAAMAVVLVPAIALMLATATTALADPYTKHKIEYNPPAVPGKTQLGVIHGDYQKNTDACAGCHTPHKAPGPELLRYNGVQAVCKACHDGTQGVATYNVYAGTYLASNGTVYKNGGGPFAPANQQDFFSFSAHPVDSQTHWTTSAPGGSTDGYPDENGTWKTILSCAACHTAHGQGNNGRILNPDTNGIAIANAVLAEKGTYNSVTGKVSFAKAHWLFGYPYDSRTGFVVNTNDNTSAGFTWSAATQKVLPVDAGDTVLQAGVDYTFDTNNQGYRLGYILLTQDGKAKVAGHSVYGAYVPGLRVVLNVTNYLSWSDPAQREVVTYEQGINAFCGACHTDYNTAKFAQDPARNLNGKYTKAYRHKVGMDWDATNNGLAYENNGGNNYKRVTCLTCHYAHGTDKGFFVDNTGGYDLTAAEKAGSSFLKRMPNMGTCDNCHQKGAASTY